MIMTLEQALEFIDDDELVEITPENIRVRKLLLKESERKRLTFHTTPRVSTTVYFGMKAVLQRVRCASVAVDGDVVGEIEQGLLIYLGVAGDDGLDQVAWLVDKIANLRIFDDPVGAKTTFSVKEVGGAALVISQFTLLADAAKVDGPLALRRRHRKKRAHFTTPSLKRLAKKCPCKPVLLAPTCRCPVLMTAPLP